MARGFESKSVQSQWQDAEDRAEQRLKKRKSPEQVEEEHRRDSLNMSRARVIHDLNSARTEVHRRSLQAALEHLDEQLAALKTERGPEPRDPEQ